VRTPKATEMGRGQAAAVSSEGRIEVEKGHRIAYRIFGTGNRTLLGLHGGPGVSSRYLDRLREVTAGELKLVLYDQLGGGESDRPDDPTLWKIPRFIQEVETVRTTLNLGVVTLFGQSWGGMLALAYTLEYPEYVNALVLSNTYASGKHYLLDIAEHRMSLGADMHAMMLRREFEGNLDAPDYQDAVLELNSRHLRRSSPTNLPGRGRSSRRLQRRTSPILARPTPCGGLMSSGARGLKPTSTSPTDCMKFTCQRSSCVDGTTSCHQGDVAALWPMASRTMSMSSSATQVI
jgi:pimeloyl-ACP methyl ester carboxylesterase